MIRRTLYFGNPAYLKTKDEQLVIEMQDIGETKTAHIEDIGIVISDHPQIAIAQALPKIFMIKSIICQEIIETDFHNASLI